MKNKWYGAEIMLLMFGFMLAINIIPGVSVTPTTEKGILIFMGIIFVGTAIVSMLLRERE